MEKECGENEWEGNMPKATYEKIRSSLMHRSCNGIGGKTQI